jgi:hypothetical protein
VFTWERFDGANFRIQARARSTAGTLNAVQTLSAAGENGLDAQVGVDAGGDAVFTWQRFDGTNTRIQARARSTTGTLSVVQTLSAAGQPAFQPQVGVGADGNAVFSWLRSDGANDRAEARARPAAGTLGPVTTLSAAGQNASGPQVGVGAGGDAVVSWYRSDGTNYRIQASAGP